ncbi:hypothetical protein P3T76_012425 [Phytophthora citrophthora]|uniref:Uncharacterized protein n=1 Tax=Phytophthora citrophthora TaxID=4793 RepID=A0AAD9LD18_9STRA|nr:hypothetical protein P3T76_012425 [Phytophthora citrophthora]
MSSAIPRMSLSFESEMEALLHVMQTLAMMLCWWEFVSTCFTPLPPDSDNGPKELNNLLVPPHYVLRVGMSAVLCFLLNVSMAPKTTTGSFTERYSTGEDNELYLNLAALDADISASVWMIFKLLHWRYLAIIAFGCMWCGSLPIYLASTQKSPLNPRLRSDTFRDSIVFFNEQISLSLYFTWLTGALIFGLLDVAQYIYGSIFSYNIYSKVMVGMLVFGIGDLQSY